VLVEKTEEAPDSDAGTIFIFALDIHGSLLYFGSSAAGFPEMGLRVYVTIEDSILGALEIRQTGITKRKWIMPLRN
jgi:hypothetical protein